MEKCLGTETGDGNVGWLPMMMGIHRTRLNTSGESSNFVATFPLNSMLSHEFAAQSPSPTAKSETY
jgi:hypothetical protein